MKTRPGRFKEMAAAALVEPDIQKAMAVNREFAASVRRAVAQEPQLEPMRTHARRIKDLVLNHLPAYLGEYEHQAQKKGIQVHWADTAEAARSAIARICERAGARTAVCAKSMIAAELDLASALQRAGVERFETDLGEYILQLAGNEPQDRSLPGPE
jgi:L-lactate dehydrogenase complex protein LldF